MVLLGIATTAVLKGQSTTTAKEGPTEMDQLHDFLTQRGISPELAIGKHQVSLGEMYGKQGIIIPFVKGGKTVNRKLRSWEKEFYQDKGAEKCFWNYDVIHDENLRDQPIIITEGELDALSFIEAGYERTISVPDGAPNETHEEETAKYSFLEGEIANLRNLCPFVILAVDADTNGGNLVHDLGLRLGRDFCKWVRYPKGCKDINEALVNFGVAGVKKSFDTQQWLEMDGVFTSENLPPVAEAKAFDIDMPGFEEHMKIRLGDFSVVTGIPGMGKSTWVNDVMARVALKHSLKIAFASFEQHPSLDHIRNLRRWAKASLRAPEGQREPASEQVEEFIRKQFCFIYPTDKQQLEEMIDLDWFLEKASAAVIQHGAQVIVVDPWNELEHKTGRHESMTEYVGRSIKRLKHFAKANNVHVMVVAHPAKMFRDKSGNYPAPSLYDISDSAHWANKADIGIIVHRENYESSDTIISNKKSRYHEIIGFPGSQVFKFNRHRNRFEFVPPELR